MSDDIIKFKGAKKRMGKATKPMLIDHLILGREFTVPDIGNQYSFKTEDDFFDVAKPTVNPKTLEVDYNEYYSIKKNNKALFLGFLDNEKLKSIMLYKCIANNGPIIEEDMSDNTMFIVTTDELLEWNVLLQIQKTEEEYIADAINTASNIAEYGNDVTYFSDEDINN